MLLWLKQFFVSNVLKLSCLSQSQLISVGSLIIQIYLWTDLNTHYS